MSPIISTSKSVGRQLPVTVQSVLARYPRICANIICESLGYATPLVAASILKAVIERKQHHCEWIASCYSGNPVSAVTNAIRTRRFHVGYMADYTYALALVNKAIETGEEPAFASWF